MDSTPCILILTLCVCMLSRFGHVWPFPTTWTVAHQVPLSVGFHRQEYWHGLPCPPPGDLHDQGIGPTSPALAGGLLTSVPYPPTSVGDVGLIPGLGRSPGEGMVACFCIFAWEIPWTEEPSGLQSMGSQKSWTWVSNWACMHIHQDSNYTLIKNFKKCMLKCVPLNNFKIKLICAFYLGFLKFKCISNSW